MKKFNLISGIIMILFGIFLTLYNFIGITGYVVSESVDNGRAYFAGIFVVIIGLLVLMSGKERNRQSGLEIMISRKALERVKKDKTARGYLQKYANEIEQIAKHPEVREKGYHSIGEFNISPHGHRPIRVAWHMEGNILYVDDVLYKTSQKGYVDDWDARVGRREITLRDYIKAGYVEYKTPAQVGALKKKARVA